MGTIIMCLLISVELAFCIWNIWKKDYHKTEKQMAQIAIFLLFVVLSLAGVLEWGFRYFMLALILFVQAAYGVIMLVSCYMRGRKDAPPDKAKPFRYGKCIWRFVGKSILYSTALTLAILCPQYELIPTTGDYQVATQTATYIDNSRDETYTEKQDSRAVNVEFWYPADGSDSCPLVVFSHGAYGIKQSNDTLFRELASHGYVVCSLDHPYHSFFTSGEAGFATVSQNYMRQYQEANAGADTEILYAYIQEWMAIRCGDMNFVLDTIKGKVQTDDSAPNMEKIYGMIDTETIIVSGHSMGGAAAAELGKARDDVTCAVILEAPYFGDITGVDGDVFSWSNEDYPIPVLNIYSDTAWGKFEDSIVYEKNQQMLENPVPDCLSVHIAGCRHLGLTDLSLFCPIATEVLDGGKGSRNAHDILKELNDTVLPFIEQYAR